MKKKTITSIALTLALTLALAIPAFAADVSTSGSGGSVPVALTAEAATFSVTVPTSLPIQVAADGSVTTASTAKIVNNSHGAVVVTDMKIAGKDDWEIVGYDSANMSAEKVNSRKIAMEINGEKTTADDAITFSAANFSKLDGVNDTDTDELGIEYDAKVPAQSKALTEVKVVDVTFVIGWDE